MKPRVLHLISNFVIGGAQRSVATLCGTPELDSRVETIDPRGGSSLDWADVVVLHAWRRSRWAPTLNIPAWAREIDDVPIVVFNHDWEGAYDGPVNLVLVYSQFAAANWHGRERVAVLPGGINIARFSEIAGARNWSRSCVVGRLSTLNQGKASPVTFAYWRELNAKAFLVGGAGAELAALKASCADSRFEFRGEIRPRETHKFLGDIDFFLYETDWHVESFCYVVLEALAAGCIVIASDSGAVGELIENGVNGFLFARSCEAIAVCNRLIRDPVACRALSKVAAISAQRFSSHLMQSKFFAEIAELLNKGRG